MPNHRAEDVLAFWFGEGADYGRRHKRWFEKQTAFDAEVAQRFLGLYEQLAAGREWLDSARERLARLLVLHQVPRNMFRRTARAVATAGSALATATPPLQRRLRCILVPVVR